MGRGWIAEGVVANDIGKITGEALGGFLTAWLPDGPIFGSRAGRAGYKNHINPTTNANGNALHEERFRRAHLNKPWLIRQSYLGRDPKVHPSEDDEYVDAGSGLIRRRSATDQATCERIKFVDWRPPLTMEQIKADHACGRIDNKTLVDDQASFRQRMTSAPWGAKGYEKMAPDPSAWAGADVADTEDDTASSGCATANPDPAHADAIASAVGPIGLRAVGRIAKTFSDWDEVATSFDLALWTLGALSSQHAQAVMKISSTADKSFALTGTFSGGPNGTLIFQDGDSGSFSFCIQDRTQVVGEVESLINNATQIELVSIVMPLSNPSAFDA